MSKRKVSRRRNPVSSGLSLQGTDEDRKKRYQSALSEIQTRFSLTPDQVPTEWVTNLAVFFQYADASILAKSKLRITDEEESLSESGRGTHIGNCTDGQTAYFVWIEVSP